MRITMAVAMGLVLAGGARAQGVVWTVGGVAPDFLTVQEGVDAAGEGDVLLIRPKSGGYGEAVLVSGKSLSFVADDGPPVSIDHPGLAALRVENLGPGQSFHARGLSLRGRPALELAQNQGPVLIEDSVLAGFQPISVLPEAGHGAVVQDCGAVTFVRCQMEGGHDAGFAPSFFPYQGGIGLVATDSTLHLYEVTAQGGFGSSADGFDGIDGGDGGDGARLQDSFLFAAASALAGGTGGPITNFLCLASDGPGGDGLAALGASDVYELDSTFTGGLSGLGYCEGTPGQPVVGSAISLPGDYRSLTAASPVREGELSTSTYVGQPGDLVFGIWGVRQEPVFYQVFGGTVLPQVLAAVLLGTIPAGGTLAFSLPLGQLPPGVDSLSLYSQAVILPASSPLILTNGTGVVILDDAF